MTNDDRPAVDGEVLIALTKLLQCFDGAPPDAPWSSLVPRDLFEAAQWVADDARARLRGEAPDDEPLRETAGMLRRSIEHRGMAATFAALQAADPEMSAFWADVERQLREDGASLAGDDP
jgi:hypothetical protein